MSDKTGGPAFPVAYSNENDGPVVMPSSGVTLRDYFAARAPEVPEWFGKLWFDGDNELGGHSEHEWERYFRWRWHYADMMLAERSKP